jgi:hypothetical protein
MVVMVTINDEQNNEENITAICWVLRTVFSYTAALKAGWNYVGRHNSARESAKPCRWGLWRIADDWRTLGIHGGIEDDEPWRKMFGPDVDSN